MLLKLYISSTFNHISRRHHEQIIQIFHPRHPVLMYLSSPRQVYSTEKLRSRNRHFSRYFHNSTNRSKVALIFTGDSVLNRTLAEQVISSWIFDEFIICSTIFLIPPTSALSLPLCVPHPPANCVNITHFYLIYQGVLQRIFGMLSVKIGSFLTMLRRFCLLSRHFGIGLLYIPEQRSFQLHKKLTYFSKQQKMFVNTVFCHHCYIHNCLLNTPQQRSFSRIFDVSYPPCQTILRCSGISGHHFMFLAGLLQRPCFTKLLLWPHIQSLYYLQLSFCSLFSLRE